MALNINIKGEPEDLDGILPLMHPGVQQPLIQAQKPGSPAPDPIFVHGQPGVAGLTPPQTQNFVEPAAKPPLGRISTQQFTAPAMGRRSLLGKIGTGLRYGAEAAGSTFFPAAMAAIPGTSLNKVREAGIEETKARAEEARAAGVESRARAGATEATGELTGQEVQAGYGTALAKEATGRGELTTEQAQIYKDAMAAMDSPAIKQAFATLSDMNAQPDARRAAMAAIGQSPIGMLPMLRGEESAAENIYREGEVGQRGRRLVTVNGPNGPQQYLTDAYGNVLEGPYLASPGYYPKTTGHVEQGPGGVFQTVPTTTAPRLPGGGAAARGAAPGGAPVAAGGTRAPVGGPALAPFNQTEQKQMDSITQADNIAAQLYSTLQQIQTTQGQLGQAIQNRTMNFIYNRGLAPPELQDQFIQLSGLLKVVGSMPFAVASRNYRWIQQTQQHLSDPNATFGENMQRVQRLVNEIYPGLQEGLFRGKYGKNAERAAQAYGITFPKTGRAAGRPAGTAGAEGQPVYLNGKLIGHTTDGKTMTPVKP